MADRYAIGCTAAFFAALFAGLMYVMWSYEQPMRETQPLVGTGDVPDFLYLRDAQGRCWQIRTESRPSFRIMKDEACLPEFGGGR